MGGSGETFDNVYFKGFWPDLHSSHNLKVRQTLPFDRWWSQNIVGFGLVLQSLQSCCACLISTLIWNQVDALRMACGVIWGLNNSKISNSIPEGSSLQLHYNNVHQHMVLIVSLRHFRSYSNLKPLQRPGQIPLKEPFEGTFFSKLRPRNWASRFVLFQVDRFTAIRFLKCCCFGQFLHSFSECSHDQVVFFMMCWVAKSALLAKTLHSRQILVTSFPRNDV